MRKAPFVRSPYNYDLDLASDEATIPAHLQGESLTIQSQSLDTDINEIMRRQGIGPQFPQNGRVPQYGDFTGISDFRSALEAVRNGFAAFAAYPPEFRSRFQNDPQLFLEWAESPSSHDELVKLGMRKALAEGERQAFGLPPATTLAGGVPIAAPGASGTSGTNGAPPQGGGPPSST